MSKHSCRHLLQQKMLSHKAAKPRWKSRLIPMAKTFRMITTAGKKLNQAATQSNLRGQSVRYMIRLRDMSIKVRIPIRGRSFMSCADSMDLVVPIGKPSETSPPGSGPQLRCCIAHIVFAWDTRPQHDVHILRINLLRARCCPKINHACGMHRLWTCRILPRPYSTVYRV